MKGHIGQQKSFFRATATSNLHHFSAGVISYQRRVKPQLRKDIFVNIIQISLDWPKISVLRTTAISYFHHFSERLSQNLSLTFKTNKRYCLQLPWKGIKD